PPPTRRAQRVGRTPARPGRDQARRGGWKERYSKYRDGDRRRIAPGADLPRRCETKRGQEDRRSGTSSTATETDDASRRAQTCPAGARPSEARRIEGAVHQVPRLRPTTHRAGRRPAPPVRDQARPGGSKERYIKYRD